VSEFSLPKGWIFAPIGDLCDLINGRAFKQTEWREKGLPIIRIQNLNKAHAMFNYFDGELEEKHLVNYGDLLFAWSGTPGTSFGAHEWRGEQGALNQHIFKLVFEAKHIEKSFFLHSINFKLNELIGNANGGVGLRHVTKGVFESTLLEYPPLAEQQQIAQKLNELLAQVGTLKSRLDAIPKILKRFRQSVLAAAVSGRLTEEWRAINETPIKHNLLGKISEYWAAAYKINNKKFKAPIIPALENPSDKLPENWTNTQIGYIFDVHVGATPSRAEEIFWGGEVNWVSSS